MKQTAEYLKVDYETILRFIKRGTLKAAKIGRVYRLNKDDVDRLMGVKNDV